MLATETSGNAQPVMPVPPAQGPVQPLVYSNQIVEQVDADSIGMESVMQFVTSTFTGAKLMDHHSVSLINDLLRDVDVTFIRAVIHVSSVKGTEKRGVVLIAVTGSFSREFFITKSTQKV